jgi:hypothetical protein
MMWRLHFYCIFKAQFLHILGVGGGHDSVVGGRGCPPAPHPYMPTQLDPNSAAFLLQLCSWKEALKVVNVLDAMASFLRPPGQF